MGIVVPRMDATQARAWVALVSVAESLPRALDTQLTTAAGLANFEYGILSVLIAAPQRTLRMGDVACALGSPAPKLSKAITRLERRGLVERLACPDDGRAIDVHLTRDGRRAWLAATPSHILLARDTLLADLDHDDLIHLAALLERVLHRLDPDWELGQVPAQVQP
ncbi:MarR family winged helix-turn-helix transcriptional regulator [Microbacterium sp. LWH3-1.2]|uniref:MarR family winged helix-turn-helix transcriptional regulator n=1 Tax=Microbacterium sp. LWH3-1.2 TaxID=3135256 RepID=UPI003418C0D5